MDVVFIIYLLMMHFGAADLPPFSNSCWLSRSSL